MASVIKSAQVSTASVFDVVTKTTSLITDTLDIASMGVDALHSKAQIMHASVTANTQEKIAYAKERGLEQLRVDHVVAMYELKKQLERTPEIKQEYINRFPPNSDK